MRDALRSNWSSVSKKPSVHEVMVLDTRERERECRVLVAGHEGRVDLQETRRAFPDAPCARCRQPRGLIVGSQASVIGGDQVVPFGFRDRREIRFPCIGKQPRRAFLVEPFQFPASQHEDAAQHQFGDPLRMRLRICQGQGRAPAATEHLPAFDAQGFAQPLDVVDEVPRGVVDKVGVRHRTPAAALVEQNDAVLGRIVESPHLRAASGAGTAMQQHHGFALRIAALFVIERVARIDCQPAGVVGLDVGIQRAHVRVRPVGRPV